MQHSFYSKFLELFFDSIDSKNRIYDVFLTQKILTVYLEYIIKLKYAKIGSFKIKLNY